MDILMILILPIHERGMCFHLFQSSLISFFSVVQFSECRSFTSLVRFILRYFNFLVAIVNEMFFLISFSDISFIVHKNSFDFRILTFISPFCQNHLLGQVVFGRSLYGFLCTLSCYLQTEAALLPPFQFRCLLFLFLV